MGPVVAVVIGFQLVWWISVGGAARGIVWAGPAAALIFGAWHCRTSENPRGDAVFLVVAAAIGYLFDSCLVAAGLLTFAGGGTLGGPTPLWMVGLWVAFAVSLRRAFGWIGPRLWLGAVLGALLGPPAYWAGMRVGAAGFGESSAQALAAIAIEWAVALPLLQALSARLARRGELVRRSSAGRRAPGEAP